MTTDVPTDFAKAQQFLRRAFSRACSRYKLDPTQARALVRILDAETERVAAPKLPDAAPELWATRDTTLRENAAAFVRRVYAPWIGKGLARLDLNILDRELYKALSVWESRHPEDRINELPTKSDLIDRQIEVLRAVLSKAELRSLAFTLQNRHRRSPL